MIAAVAPEFTRTGGHSHGVEPWALDPAAAARLWAVSLDLPGA